MDGCAEARIIQIGCSPASEGHSRWALRLLEEKAHIELDVSVGRENICQTLKNELKPYKNAYWCIPLKENAEFVVCMGESDCNEHIACI